MANVMTEWHRPRSCFARAAALVGRFGKPSLGGAQLAEAAIAEKQRKESSKIAQMIEQIDRTVTSRRAMKPGAEEGERMLDNIVALGMIEKDQWLSLEAAKVKKWRASTWPRGKSSLTTSGTWIQGGRRSGGRTSRRDSTGSSHSAEVRRSKPNICEHLTAILPGREVALTLPLLWVAPSNQCLGFLHIPN